MATFPPTKAKRNANLDALQSSVDRWAEAEQVRIENEVQFLRAVQEGRGAKDAATRNLSTVETVVVAEIDSFILGS